MWLWLSLSLSLSVYRMDARTKVIPWFMFEPRAQPANQATVAATIVSFSFLFSFLFGCLHFLFSSDLSTDTVVVLCFLEFLKFLNYFTLYLMKLKDTKMIWFCRKFFKIALWPVVKTDVGGELNWLVLMMIESQSGGFFHLTRSGRWLARITMYHDLSSPSDLCQDC